ncbi:ABC transporter ATP-binding protein [Aquirufa antheringensis]|uniref:ABC transporter ATP-binding protein n=1 Tax=Aquirufa antheringensis TaxID=2516559 RepID=A0A4Q9BA47_9BACT|nr:ABC transporter ATP-binding protein [Aquirufa antheringensis]MCZ2485621.1 ABC transporter ATP-binding protein [Aquirufa antheringensis]MCZ2486674.1 ABC transporter ATP-binding protein [Aquirufa antheringensis]MCZ2488545.1 ABC transporter ATP-binding protein [Aquirufa antheringensis]TBH71901.1 ABC transporter ATP-binding protein [Aquirufa antheringensis]
MKEANSGKTFDFQIIKRLYGFIQPYRFRFWFLVFLILCMAGISPVVPLLIRYTLDNYLGLTFASDLVRMLGWMLGALLLQTGLQFSTSYLAGYLGQTVIRDIRIQLYEKIVNLRLAFFDATPIGRLVTRTVSDIETLNDVFSEGLASIAGDLLQLFLILGVMFYADWRLTLIIIATVPFMVFSTYVFKEYIKKSFNEVRTAVANLNSFVQEHISGMLIVQMFHAEKQELAKFNRINEEHRDANIRGILAYSVFFPVADVIAAIGTGLVVWAASTYIVKEEMGVGTLTAFIMFINLFYRPIRMLADRFNTLQMGIVSTERILTLLDSTDYIQNNGTIQADHIEGKITFSDVTFAYQEPEWVVKNVSFTVEAGKTCAIVGATGAGKSSIIGLLGRLYDCQSGDINIDGVPLTSYEIGSLRKNIAVVLQDVFLFSSSIAYNIHLGDESITQDKMVEAAKAVGVHDFILSLPGGYDYEVKERGATLSVGQRQLISFVRALVHNPKIIVLDEATSSVDSETEVLIQQAISTLMKGRTAVVIAHRLSTIRNSDQILVMDKGEIKERGTQDELLALDGLYAQLYHLQFRK